MPAFVPPQVDHNLYKPILPQDHLMQVFTLLDQKQQLYNQGVKQAQYKVSSMLNLENEVTSGPVKGMVTDFNKKAQEQIRKYSNLDFSLQGNVDLVSSVYNPLLNDRLFLQDYSATKNLNGEMAKGLAYRDSDKKETRDMFSNTNLQALQIKKYRLASSKTEKDIYKYAGEGVQSYYEPYHDYQAEIQSIISTGKLKMVRTVDSADKNNFVYTFTNENGSQSYKSFDDYIRASLSPKAKRQMQIEGEVEYFGMERQLGKEGILQQYISTNVLNYGSPDDLPEVKARKRDNERLRTEVGKYADDSALSPDILMEKYQKLNQISENEQEIISHTKLFDSRIKELDKYNSGEITLDQYYENIVPELLDNYVRQTTSRVATSYADVTKVEKIEFNSVANRLLFDREKEKYDQQYNLYKDAQKSYEDFFKLLQENNINDYSAEQIRRDAIALANKQPPTGTYNKVFAPEAGGKSSVKLKLDADGNVIPSSVGISENIEALLDYDLTPKNEKDDDVAWDAVVSSIQYPKSEKYLDAETIIKINAKIHGVSQDEETLRANVENLLAGKPVLLTNGTKSFTVTNAGLNNAEEAISQLLELSGNPAGLKQELQEIRANYSIQKEKAALISQAAKTEFKGLTDALSKYSIDYAVYGLNDSRETTSKISLDMIFNEDFSINYEFFKGTKIVNKDTGKEVASVDNVKDLKAWLFKMAAKGPEGKEGFMSGRASLYPSFNYEGSEAGTAVLNEENVFRERIAGLDVFNPSAITSSWFNKKPIAQNSEGEVVTAGRAKAAKMIQSLTHAIADNPELVNRVVVTKSGTTVIFNQELAKKYLTTGSLTGKDAVEEKNTLTNEDNEFLRNISSSGVKVARTEENKEFYTDRLYNQELLKKVRSVEGDALAVGKYKYKAIADGSQVKFIFTGTELPNDYAFLSAGGNTKIRITPEGVVETYPPSKMSSNMKPVSNYNLKNKHDLLTLLNLYNSIDNKIQSEDFMIKLEDLLKKLTPEEDGYFVIPTNEISSLLL